MNKKGIFCLEGLWYEDLRKKSTVKPILDLLELNSDIPFLHSDCATIEEFKFYLKKWRTKKYANYPVLYLAFHGLKNGILIEDKLLTLDELSGLLEGKCKNRIIVFASCNTVSVDKQKLREFLQKTKALAICGYKLIVPWISSTAFELILLASLQDNVFDGRGIGSIRKRVMEAARMFRKLDFLMITKKDLK